MVECGVGVVNLSWWGQGSFSDQAVPLVMDVMCAHDIQVTFEPYSRTRVDRFASDIQYLLTEYGDKRGWDAFFLHQRADGTRGPVFKLFNTTLPAEIEDCHGVMQDVPGYVPDSAWKRSTDQVHELLHRTFPHVTLLADTWDARRVKAAGFDGIATYRPGRRARGLARPCAGRHPSGHRVLVQRERRDGRDRPTQAATRFLSDAPAVSPEGAWARLVESRRS